MVCLWNDTSLIAELGSSFTCVYGYTNPLVSHFTFCQPAKPFSLIAPQAYVAFIVPCQYAVLWHVMPFLHLHWVTARPCETGSWWQMCAGSTGGQSDVELCQATAGSGSQHLSGWSMSTQQCQLSPPQSPHSDVSRVSGNVRNLVLKRLSFSEKCLRLLTKSRLH